MRNTKAFKQAVTATVEHLDRLGVTGIGPLAIADTIERNVIAVSQQLHIQVASAWRYFDAEALAQSIAEMADEASSQHGGAPEIGQPPLPDLGNPELAMLIGGFPDSLAECGGDLHKALLAFAMNVWQAGHIAGEDGCTGCHSRGPGDHDYAQRMDSIRQQIPNVEIFFDARAFNVRMKQSGYEVTRQVSAR